MLKNAYYYYYYYKREMNQQRQSSEQKEKEYKRMCKSVRYDKEEWLQKECHDIEKRTDIKYREAYSDQADQLKVEANTVS